MSDIPKIIEQGAREYGLSLPDGAVSAFCKYYTLLERKGKNFNLTAISGEKDVAQLHFLDSLALFGSADFRGARVIDVGSGAGFPGVPLILIEPSINLTLLDATAKRVTFLLDLCAELGIAAACLHARAEEAARLPDLRELFDIAVSRAVARLPVLCELCLPFVRVGGLFLAMKSDDSEIELEEARGVIEFLGGAFFTSTVYMIPETTIKRSILIIRKISPTPETYPRRFAKIKKN